MQNKAYLDRALRSLGNVPLSHEVLLSLLAGYRRPNDKIADWVAKGVLLPVRRSLYVLGPDYRDHPIALPLVANVLVGPSCVSLEYALSWHGLIPEGVFDVTSVTIKRSRVLDTPLGRFSYVHLPQTAYGIGIRMEPGPGGVSFLMASPEKALCDLVMLTRRLPALSVSAMLAWLGDHMRVDMERVREMNRQVVVDCIGSGYKSRHLSVLAQALEALR